MAVYRVAFKMARGIEDGEVISCDEHAFDRLVELTDVEADRIWELLNEGGVDNVLGEYYDLGDTRVEGTPAELTGAAPVEAAYAELARLCVH